MASFNKVIVMGNLCHDIELKYTQGGTAVCELSLAINDKRKGSNGEWIEEVTYVDVTCWGRTAEIAAEYLGKGSPILIEGRLKLDTWEKDGQKRSKLRVVCENLRMLGGNKRPGQGGDGSEYDQSEQTEQRRQPPAQGRGRSQGSTQQRRQPPVDEGPAEGSARGGRPPAEDGDIPF